MRSVITSLQNSEVKWVAALQKRKQREQEGLFAVEGLRLAEDAFYSNWKVDSGFFSEGALENPRIVQLLNKLQASEIKIHIVTDAVYRRITETQEPQGVMLIVKKRSYSLDSLSERRVEKQAPLYIVLDRIQDPGNVGTIIRTAEAAGCTAVLAVKGTADIFSGKAVRSTMGSLFRIPIIADMTKEEVMSFAKEQLDALLVTALAKEATPYFSRDFLRSTAIVFGNEANGADEFFLNAQCEKIYIPMRGATESLNVASAASIVIYEAVRQQMTLL